MSTYPSSSNGKLSYRNDYDKELEEEIVKNLMVRYPNMGVRLRYCYPCKFFIKSKAPWKKCIENHLPFGRCSHPSPKYDKKTHICGTRRIRLKLYNNVSLPKPIEMWKEDKEDTDVVSFSNGEERNE